MQNKNSKKGKFAGKGYYIALILCVVAIGISGYLYSLGENDPSMQDPNATVDVMNPGESENTGPSSSVPAPTEPTKNPFRTGKPVSGNILMDYAMDCLCYNPTTRDWRTHDGMDFAAEAGSPVKAAADGTVYTVFTDDSMGTTVVIRHDNGYVTTYASLDKDVSVSAGDKVTLGQTIGKASNSAFMENALGDHVHFAVTCNGQSVDPEDFFDLGK